MRLIAHPSSSYPRPLEIECEIVRANFTIGIGFSLRGPIDRFSIPEPAEQVRQDELWRHTCFEAFFRPTGHSEYHEFNMSPSTAWATYRFGGYRSGFEQSFLEPVLPIEVTKRPLAMELSAFLDLGDDPMLRGPLEVGLSAIIEELDGTKSYWALAHPDGPPDFHHDACFVASLPPIAHE